jgi:hypothetical protein
MDLAKVAQWCEADPRLFVTSTQPLRVALYEVDGTTTPASIAPDGAFLRLATRVDLDESTLELVRDPEVRASLDGYLRSLVRARSSLSQVLLAPDASCVDIEVAVHDDGLNGHTFLVAVQELCNLAQTVSPALSGLSQSVAALRDSRAELLAAEEAQRGTREQVERIKQEIAREDAEILATIDGLQDEVESRLAAPSACQSCGGELQPNARFCIHCGTAV